MYLSVQVYNYMYMYSQVSVKLFHAGIADVTDSIVNCFTYIIIIIGVCQHDHLASPAFLIVLAWHMQYSFINLM